MKPALVAIASFAALVACAGGAARRGAAAIEEYQPYVGSPVASAHFFRLDGWAAVDDTHVVIYTTVNTAYLVSVYGPCPELAFTNRLGVTSTNGEISHFESLLVRGQQRCPIAELRLIDIKRMHADRAAERAAARAAAPH